jgi:hypothetical protein
MTRSITAQRRAATAHSSNDRRSEQFLSSEESPAQISSAQRPETPPSLRVPLGSCNGVSSNHGGHKRHQSLSPPPSGHMNGNGRALTPPHTPPKLHHNGTSTAMMMSTMTMTPTVVTMTSVQNGHSSSDRSPSTQSRCQ